MFKCDLTFQVSYLVHKQVGFFYYLVNMITLTTYKNNNMFRCRHVGRATLTNSYDGRSSRPGTGTGHSSSCIQHHFHGGHRHPRHSVNAASQTAKPASTANVQKHPKLEFQSSSVNMIEAGNSKAR